MRAFAFGWTLLAAGSAAISASAPVQPERTPLDLQMREARREAAAAEADQKRAERAAAEARNAADKLHLEQVAAAQAIAAQEARISSADAEARLLGAKLALQRQQLARQRAPLSSLLAGLALMGQRPPIAMLADSRSPHELVKVKLLLEAIAPAVQARSAALAAELDQGRRLEQAALAAREGAIASRAELERRKLHLARLELKAGELAERRGSEALGAGDVTMARADEVARLERASSGAPLAFGSARQLARLGPAPVRAPAGRAPPPLAYRLPATAAVTEGLGSLGETGVRARGVSLATRRGDPVVAPASGVVLFAGPFHDYDGVVIIDHGSGWRSVLVNVGSTAARGSKVAIGQPLGSAMGPIEVQLQHRGRPVSAALIAGSYALLSNDPKSE